MARYTATYTSAQTDAVLVSVPSGSGFRMQSYAATLDRACTVPYVTWKLEFDDTTDVYIGGHDGMAPGPAYGETAPYGSNGLMEGADGQDVLFTCEVPTGGQITIVVNGEMFPTT